MNIILLRGLMRESRHWGDFPKILQNKNKFKKVLCLDLPGVGTEQGRFFYPDLKEVVKDLRSRFLQSENHKLEDSWNILGVSLGGMIALKWAEMFPNDFKQGFVINTSASDSGKLWQRLKPSSYEHLFKITSSSSLEQREKEIISMISNLRSKDSKLIQEWIDIAQTSKFSKKTAIQQLIAASRFKLPKQLPIPFCILTSRADRMVDYQNSIFIANKYQAKLEVHPTAGHDLTTDDPHWVADKVHLFLS